MFPQNTHIHIYLCLPSPPPSLPPSFSFTNIFSSENEQQFTASHLSYRKIHFAAP